MRPHMTDSPRSLSATIARCPVLASTLGGEATPCRSVVSWLGPQLGLRYLPEAWYGHLAEAPLLFVSSNPGAGARTDPVLPGLWVTSESSDEEVFLASDSAFEPGQSPGIVDGTHMVDRHGKRHGRSVRYWTWARRMAREFLDAEPVPGRDYAMTEMVHCGSQHEYVVAKALATCSHAYLRPILALSPATVVVLVGDKARSAFTSEMGLSVHDRVSGPEPLADRIRWVIALPHPNSRGKRWGLEHYLDAAAILGIRGALAGRIGDRASSGLKVVKESGAGPV